MGEYQPGFAQMAPARRVKIFGFGPLDLGSGHHGQDPEVVAHRSSTHSSPQGSDSSAGESFQVSCETYQEETDLYRGKYHPKDCRICHPGHGSLHLTEGGSHTPALCGLQTCPQRQDLSNLKGLSANPGNAGRKGRHSQDPRKRTHAVRPGDKSSATRSD